MVRESSDSLPSVLEVLERHRWEVFRRLGCDLLAAHLPLAQQIAVKWIFDEELLEQGEGWPEFSRLLKRTFLILTIPQREDWLKLIERGPKRKRPADTMIRWRKRLLAPVAEHLPEAWLASHGEWLPKPEELRGPIVELTAGWGSRKAMKADQLLGIPMAQLVEFLRSAVAEDDFEGLREALTEAAHREPGRFASEAEAFCRLGAGPASAVLKGLCNAAREKREFSWEHFLNLCVEVLSNFAPIERDDDDSIRKPLADLLEGALGDDKSGIPSSLRRNVWQVLYPLTEDLDPTPKREERCFRTRFEPANLALNTVRGKALQAVLSYARWVRKNSACAPQVSELGDMPEVMAVLDKHLDPKSDPSLAVRSVFGMNLGLLFWLDRTWVRSRSQRIFPLSGDQEKFLGAAWDAFLAFSGRPPSEFAQILEPQYERAIDGLSAVRENAPRYAMAGSLEYALIDHLVTFYARGILDLSDKRGLLSRFYRQANEQQHALVIENIGRNLRNLPAEFEIPTDVLERIKNLWTHRLEEVHARGRGSAELEEFGWWFVSGRLDRDWGLAQLRESLSDPGFRTSPDHHVLEELESLFPSRPLEVLECLDLIVKGNRGDWRIEGLRSKILAILKRAWDTSDAGARGLVARIANRLIARSFSEFEPFARRAASAS